jgi:tetratricopeptide (TPR) repeat protein
LGYPDTALRYAGDALLLARRLNNVFAAAFSLSITAQIHCQRRDFRRSLEASEEALRLCTASGFLFQENVEKIVSAWARAQLGEVHGAVEQIREGLAGFNAAEFYLARAWFLNLLCETQTLAGAFDDALVTVEQALEANPDELLYRPEALRLRGELRLRSAPRNEVGQLELAERDLREAIEIARRIGAKSDELRATTSFARLLARTGHYKEGRGVLSEIYCWFTEGSESVSLREAKELLDEFNAAGGFSGGAVQISPGGSVGRA